MENEIETSLKAKFYQRLANDLFNQSKKISKIFLSKGSTSIIKTSDLPMKSL